MYGYVAGRWPQLWVLALLLGAVAILGGCDDGDGGASDFDVRVEADRRAGNAPLVVAFEARHNGPLDAAYTFAWGFGDGEVAVGEALSYTFATPGSYGVDVVVTADGARGVGTADVVVTPSADLQISEVSFDLAQASAGDEIGVSFGLMNGGGDVVGAYDVAVVLSADAAFDAADRVLVLVPRRDDAQSERPVGLDLVVTLPDDLERGTYFVGVVADVGERIGELDEANNSSFAPLALTIRNEGDSGPDLALCGVEVVEFSQLAPGTAPAVEVGAQLTVRVCLANQGDRVVLDGGVGLRLSSDEQLSEDDIVVGQRGGLVLDAGDQETVSLVIDVPMDLAPGLWNVLAVADPDGVVAERREDNNLRVYPGGFQVAEAGEVQGVDLVLMEVVVDEPRVFWGQTLTGTLTLANRGDQAVARPFVVRVFAEPEDGGVDIQLAGLNLAGIEADTERAEALRVPITPRLEEGSYRLYAVVDPTGGTGDVNPGNNRRAAVGLLTLGGAPSVDATVDSVRFGPEQVNAGETLDVVIDFANLGTDPTGGLEAALVLSADSEITLDGADRVIERFAVPSIGAMGEVSVARTVQIPLDLDQQVREWRVAVMVDPDDALTDEIDEANNVRVAASRLTVVGATGGCAEDAHEQNDLPLQAVALAPGLHEALGLCDDADWFEIAVPADEVLDVWLSWPVEAGTLSVNIVDRDDAVLAVGEPAVANEGRARAWAFVASAAEARTLRLEIRGAGARTQYDLEVALNARGATPNLRVRGVQVAPALAQAGATVQVSFEVVNVGGGQAALSEAGLHLTSGEAPAGAPLARVDTPVLAGGATVSLSTQLEIPGAQADGRYLLFVAADTAGVVAEGDEADNLGAGALRLDALQACPVDVLEPNGSPHEPEGGLVQAVAIAPGETVGLASCRGDDDWYAVQLEAGERLDVTIDFISADGDLEMALYGPDGEQRLDLSAGLQNQEAVQLLRAPETGTYFVRVYLNASDALSTGNGYALTLTVQPADLCENDAHEPNDDPAVAALLPDARHDLTLCPGDVDWFRFNLPAGNTVRFQISSGAEVRIALFAPDGALIDEDGRSISHEAAQTGFHTLRVQVEGDARVPYELVVAGVSGVDLVAETLRLSSAEAEPGASLRADLTVTNGRGDAAENVRVRFLLSTDEVDSIDDVVLGESIIEHLDGAGEAAVQARFDLPEVLEAGDYFVVAVLDPDREVPDVRRANNLIAEVLSVTVACVDDDPQSNEGPRSATPLEFGVGLYEGGVICPATEDWFALTVPEDGMLTLRLTQADAAGDLDLYLWSVDGDAPLAQSATGELEEVVEVPVLADDALWVRIDGFLDARNAYTLSWSLR